MGKRRAKTGGGALAGGDALTWALILGVGGFALWKGAQELRERAPAAGTPGTGTGTVGTGTVGTGTPGAGTVVGSPAPVPMPSPVPAPAPVPMPSPVPAPAPVPMPSPVPSTSPAPAPAPTYVPPLLPRLWPVDWAIKSPISTQPVEPVKDLYAALFGVQR